MMTGYQTTMIIVPIYQILIRQTSTKMVWVTTAMITRSGRVVFASPALCRAECGPGAYCGEDSRCYMTCRDSSDCPGNGTTICQNLGDYSTCVNADYIRAGLCPDTYTCGELPAPIAGPEPEPESEIEPELGQGDEHSTQPEDHGLNQVENGECLPPDMTRKGDEFCHSQPPGIVTHPAQGRPTLNPFSAGGCYQASGQRSSTWRLWTVLLTLLSCRRRTAMCDSPWLTASVPISKK
jgi:hypothetical protein